LSGERISRPIHLLPLGLEPGALGLQWLFNFAKSVDDRWVMRLLWCLLRVGGEGVIFGVGGLVLIFLRAPISLYKGTS
jgi:hypothetical protein